MALPRTLHRSLRRAAAPALRPQPAARAVAQRRLAATETASKTSPLASGSDEILIQQRLHRPVSPHLSIYRPQITWYGSALHRNTGVLASGGLYLFGFAYLAAPAFGWHLESQSLVAAFGALPAAAKVGAKLAVAWPVFFHSFNGIRHLVWDTGRGLSNKAVMRSGWAVIGLSTLVSLYFATIG